MIYIHILICLGPREQIISYFASIGYQCPSNVDIADYLLELATPERQRYQIDSNNPPQNSDTLAKLWKESSLYQQNIDRFKDEDKESYKWTSYQTTSYAGSVWFHLKLLFHRHFRLLTSNVSLLKVNNIQS